jgi:hypothetical protein
MSDKMISVKKLKQGVLAIFALCKKPNYDQILKLIDSLAQPNELDQISSKDYGADGVGLTHAEVDALAQSVEPVKTDGKSAIIEFKKIFDDFSPPTCDLANRILDAIESAGVEFAPEPPEPSAVEKWTALVTLEPLHQTYSGDEVKGVVKVGNAMRDEQQARISDLESQVNIIADENQSLEKRIEEKDAETARLENCYNDAIETIASDNAYIKNLKEPVPESPELAKAKNDYYSYRSEYELQWVPAYVAALESDNARLRGAGKPVVDGSNTEID